MQSEDVKFPEGDLIRTRDGGLLVGDRPLVGLLRGDGIGTDITPAMRAVVDAAVAGAYRDRRRIVWCPLHAGLEGWQRHGDELPPRTVAAVRTLKVAVKGPFTTPAGDRSHVCLHCAHQQDHPGPCARCGRQDGVCPRFRSINVRLREQLDLYACVRPVKYFPGVPSPNRYADQVDLVIFRENTEDLYAGHDFQGGGETARAIIALIEERTGRRIRPGSGIGVKTISEFGTRRLVRMALQWAIRNRLPSVTLVHKGNIMRHTEGSFCRWGYATAAEEFGDAFLAESALQDRPGAAPPAGRILLRDRITDSVFQQIQTRPGEFSVLALPNLNGDYLSDAAIALVGGLGLAPGANLSDDIAVFEAAHGTAPRYAGQDRANPGALILSAAMMLRHLGWPEAADLVEGGLRQAVADGCVTYDLARLMRAEGRRDVTEVTCSDFGRAVVARMAGARS